MTTRHEAVAHDKEIVRHHTSQCEPEGKKRFGLSPTMFAFLAGVGIGKIVSWVLARKREKAVESLREQVELSKEMTAVAEGPWGGVGGKEFYDGRGEIVGITVHYNDNAVVKLQVTYEQSGARFQGSAHGGVGGETAKISLAYPTEFLKQVVGTYAPDQTIFRNEVVTSLTFITNKQKYGPFGHERGKKFETPATGVVGFYGRSGALLDRLGVLMKP